MPDEVGWRYAYISYTYLKMMRRERESNSKRVNLDPFFGALVGLVLLWEPLLPLLLLLLWMLLLVFQFLSPLMLLMILLVLLLGCGVRSSGETSSLSRSLG